MEGESHHGARNGCNCDEVNVSATSRICADSMRFSTRLASCVSFGQSVSSQSRNTGKIDSTNAIHTDVADLIGASKAGSANAKIKTKKQPQRAHQIVSKKVAIKST